MGTRKIKNLVVLLLVFSLVTGHGFPAYAQTETSYSILYVPYYEAYALELDLGDALRAEDWLALCLGWIQDQFFTNVLN
ncbi:MAG: hypothetical protein QME54_07135 [Actinomycetota bacterium]|nr:hypothetical protein [Actinomycetota bacterium]